MFYNKFQRFAKRMADDGSGGDSGGADNLGAGDNKNAPDTQVQVELLTKTVGLLAEGLQRMEGSHNDVLAALAKMSDQSKANVQEAAEVKFGEDVDLTQLDRKQFAALIIDSTRKAVQSELNKITSDVDTKVSELGARFESKNANEQINKTAEANPDFWEWSTEIKQLLKENPTLSVARAYNLAKAEDTKKAKSLDSKYNPPKSKGEQSGFGLTPTSSIGTRSGTGKMNQKEASEKAFDTVMANLGDVLNNGDLKIA